MLLVVFKSLIWSELFMNQSITTTETTTERQLCTVWRMVADWALFFPLARSYFVPASCPVTRVAVVSVSMTKPKSNWTAKLTLEIYIVGSMLLTIHYSRPYTDGWTFRANKFIGFELFYLVLLRLHFTVFHATKVRAFAFETLVVSTLEKSKLLQFVIELITQSFQSFVFIKSFVFRTLDCLNYDILLYVFWLTDDSI